MGPARAAVGVAGAGGAATWRAWPRPARRDLVLPLGLATLQLLVWPVVPALTGEAVDGWQVAAVVAVTAVVATLLCWRRERATTVLVASIVILSVAWLVLPQRTLMVIGFTDLIALYSTAVHRTARPLVVVGALAFASQVALQAVVAPDAVTAALVLVPLGMLYTLVAVLGRARRRWRAGRDAVAAQLAHRGERERYAAAAERARLARELHDVSAHHLSTIVVHGQAAVRLAERTPDDPDVEWHLAQTLDFAADTAQQTLASLRELVTVIDLDTAAGLLQPPLTGTAPADTELSGHDQAEAPTLEGIAALAEGFVRLGQPVTVTAAGAVRDVPMEVAAAGHRIAQEALTNALRYAPGAVVRIQLAYQPDQVELVVGDDGAAAAVPRPGRATSGLGGGRGIPGMRERAESLGGSLAAGPRADGGWEVRAVLPTAGGTPDTGDHAVPATRDPQRKATKPPLWSRVHHGWLLDVVLTAFATVISALFMLGVAMDPLGRAALGPPMSVALLVPLMALQAAPFLVRRRSPWLATFGSIGMVLLWLPLTAVGAISASAVFLLAATWWVDFVLVYTVAAQRSPAKLTWLAVLATAAMETAVQTVPDALRGEPGGLIDVLVLLAFSLAALSLAWGFGVYVRLRRTRTLRREGAALAELVAGAEAAVQAERSRIAHGLQGSVLAHTDRLIALARGDQASPDDGDMRGRVAAVVTESRAALTAMRELLAVLRAADGSPAGSPQPTMAGIAELCRQRRAAGEQVTLAVDGERRPLAVEVELSAFRVVEAALDGHGGGSPAAGAETPARAVTISYGREHLRVKVVGLPAGSDDTFDGLRGRIDAVGGVFTMRSAAKTDGDEVAAVATTELHVWFPAPRRVPPQVIASPW